MTKPAELRLLAKVKALRLKRRQLDEALEGLNALHAPFKVLRYELHQVRKEMNETHNELKNILGECYQWEN